MISQDKKLKPPSEAKPKPQDVPGRNWSGWLLTIGLILLVALLLNMLTSRKQNDRPADTSANTAATMSAQQAVVTITKAGFIPATIKVKAGSSVTWVNNNRGLHLLASDPYPADDLFPNLNTDEPLRQNDSFSLVFEEPGTYGYHDELNPTKFKGSVIVE